MNLKIVLSSLAMCLVAFTAPARGPVKTHGQLQVTGTRLCDAAGQPVTLRGASLGWHNLWPRFYNPHAVKWLAEDWKCSVLRAAMGIEIEDNYLLNPSFALGCIEPVVKAAIRNDIYVIIDWHAHSIHTREACDFFASMARKYGKYPHVIYEIYNEPVGDSWEQVKAYAGEVIAAIRQHDPDNVILVGSPHWDQDLHLAAADPIRGYDNIMYTLHFYAATHKEPLRQRAEAAIGAGLPVFVSECAGMEASGDGPLDYAEWDRWTEWMERLGISWVNWSVSDKNETCSMILPRASSKGGWDTSLLKPAGVRSRELIRKYNGGEDQ